MLTQYLVGLCCLRHSPDAVDVTVGDLVLDKAAKKYRDVDITVTVADPDGGVLAFKAYEVKREGKPLDVAVVEQLCAKLQDMPAVTHRAIVSASNFSEGAINKAAAYSVELFVLKPWTVPISSQFPDFPNTGKPDDFFRSMESMLLFWVGERLHVCVPSGPPSFLLEDSTPLSSAKGKRHKKFANMMEFKIAMYRRSTEILFPLEPAVTIARTFPARPLPNIGEWEVGPEWPHTHTLQIKDDLVFLKFGDEICAMDSVTITGSLQWRRRRVIPQFYIIESLGGKAFAGAAVAEWGSDDGKMLAIVFPPESRALGIHQFQLTEKHRNIIKKLKIPLTNGLK